MLDIGIHSLLNSLFRQKKYAIGSLNTLSKMSDYAHWPPSNLSCNLRPFRRVVLLIHGGCNPPPLSNFKNKTKQKQKPIFLKKEAERKRCLLVQLLSVHELIRVSTNNFLLKIAFSTPPPLKNFWIRACNLLSRTLLGNLRVTNILYLIHRTRVKFAAFWVFLYLNKQIRTCLFGCLVVECIHSDVAVPFTSSRASLVLCHYTPRNELRRV